MAKYRMELPDVADNVITHRVETFSDTNLLDLDGMVNGFFDDLEQMVNASIVIVNVSFNSVSTGTVEWFSTQVHYILIQ